MATWLILVSVGMYCVVLLMTEYWHHCFNCLVIWYYCLVMSLVLHNMLLKKIINCVYYFASRCVQFHSKLLDFTVGISCCSGIVPKSYWKFLLDFKYPCFMLLLMIIVTIVCSVDLVSSWDVSVTGNNSVTHSGLVNSRHGVRTTANMTSRVIDYRYTNHINYRG